MKPHPIHSPPADHSSPGPHDIRVSGYAYLVDFGRPVEPRLHTVHPDGTCNCGQPACPAIGLVAEWLRTGRLEPAPEPRPGFTPYLPSACPICGARVFTDHALSSRSRGLGWQCVVGGRLHYWLDKWDRVRGWFFRDPVLPGLTRSDFARNAGLPMGYLPEANRAPGRDDDD